MKRIILFSLLLSWISILSFAQNVTILPSGITPVQTGIPTGAVVLRNDNTTMVGFTNMGTTLLNYQGWIGSIPEQAVNRNNPSWAIANFGLNGISEIKIVIWGGFSSNFALPPNTGKIYLKTGQIYNYTTNTWSNMAIPPTINGRENATVSHLMNGNILVWGGNDANSTPYGDGLIYQAFTNTWTNYGGPSPAARTEHTATQAANFKYLIWGGKNGSGKLNSGRLIDMINNTWASTDISITNAPTARSGHVSYSVSGKVLIWGGFDSSNNPVNNGGIYNASTNTWQSDAEITALNSVSAPVFDANVATAYSNGIFAVFGGGNNNGGSFRGKYFDFNTDTWISFSTVSEPPALYNSSGIFVGDRLVIYGGRVGSATGSYNTTVYVYDFNTNKWLLPHSAQPNVTPILPDGGIDYPYMALYNGSQVIVMGSVGNAIANLSKQVGGTFVPLTNIYYTLFRKD